METIDERADAYCREHAQQDGYDIEDVRTAYISGAEHVREELTRWNDPEEELPALLTRVLGRYSDGENISVNIVYRRLSETGRNWFWTDGINAPLDIDGWREIHYRGEL